MSAEQKLKMINEAIEAGKTVDVVSQTRVWRTTPRTAAKWKASGVDLFSVSNGSLYMASGRKRVCIDFNAIRVN